MPRHNFNAAKPYVREFCKKYDLEYDVKPLWTGFGDIVRLFTECSSAHNTTLHISKPNVDVCVCYHCRSLKESGEIWNDTWKASDPKAK